MNNERSDAELIELIQKGNEQAFNDLYERYVKLVYYIAYRFCNNDADSQDVVQETFLQIKRTITDLNNPSLFKYWVNKITISKCKNLFRKNRYVAYDNEHYEAKNNLQETREDVQPSHLLKFNSDKEMINAFINELPQGQKEVVILHYLEQFSVEETAELLGLPQGTVKSRLSYARTALKNKVEKYEKENDTKLNFHSLDAIIAASLLASFEQCVVPEMHIGIKPFYKKINISQFLTTLAGKIILSTLLLGIGGTCVFAWLNNSSAKQEDSSLSKVLEDEINTFPETTIRNTRITSARSAYYIIKTWACCEEEMQYLSKEQITDVYQLYLVMKEDNSAYYERLVEEGWARSLEGVYDDKCSEKNI